MSRDEGHGQVPAREKHREILHAATVGKKFGLAGEPEPDFVHPRFVDGRGHDRVEFAMQGDLRCFLERVKRRLSGFRGRLA